MSALAWIAADAAFFECASVCINSARGIRDIDWRDSDQIGPRRKHGFSKRATKPAIDTADRRVLCSRTFGVTQNAMRTTPRKRTPALRKTDTDIECDDTR